MKHGTQTPRHRKDSGKEGQFSVDRSAEIEGMPHHGGSPLAWARNPWDRDGEKTFDKVSSRSIIGGLDLES